MHQNQRDVLVSAAEEWLGTDFHHAARLKGVGVDCINLLCAVYEQAGLITYIELSQYAADFFLHRDEERFLEGILGLSAHEVVAPLPGDVAVFKFGRCYSHGAIVTYWPEVIHAFAVLGGVVRGDATKHPLLDKEGRPRPVKFYTLIG